MDVEKTIQFLLEQQARFDARQAELQAQFAERDARVAERHAQFEKHQAELQAQFAERDAQVAERQTELRAQFDERQAQSEERITQIESILVDVAASQERTNAILATLTERHIELEQAQQVTQKNLNALSEGTTQKLSALIDTLERHLANHQ